MSVLKTACASLATLSFLTVAPSAFANTSKTAAIGATFDTAAHPSSRHAKGHIPVTFLGSSETSSFFYLKGVKQFEKGNLEKSEQAFRASLRAHGSKAMDRLTLHYLTNINHKQGDTHTAEKYAEAYFALDKK